MTREAHAHEERRKTLHDIVELAAKFFEATLASRDGARGRGYLLDRGIHAATQLKFRLGYAPAEQYALKEHLGAAKISVEDMAEAGLVVAGEDIPVPYDRFRDRVMFPISDWRGRVIAFGGRALDKDVSAKYLNSPETPLFHKGATLYNIAAARKAAHDGARVIAVEGYVDVIAMVTAGFEATVAPLGTALTADQLALMWRMADEPILCFDGDDAGRRAAYRALDIALPLLKPGKSLKLATLPDGQDPDDLARSGGREAIEDVLSRRAAAGACAVGARERSRPVRYAGAPRRARSAHRRSDGGDRRRSGAPLLPAGFFRPAAPDVRAADGLDRRRYQARRRSFGARRFAQSGFDDKARRGGAPPPAAACQQRRALCGGERATCRPARCIAAIAPRSRAARR